MFHFLQIYWKFVETHSWVFLAIGFAAGIAFGWRVMTAPCGKIPMLDREQQTSEPWSRERGIYAFIAGGLVATLVTWFFLLFPISVFQYAMGGIMMLIMFWLVRRKTKN